MKYVNALLWTNILIQVQLIRKEKAVTPIKKSKNILMTSFNIISLISIVIDYSALLLISLISTSLYRNNYFNQQP